MSLHGLIDDATGKILALHFRPHEDLFGYLQVLRTMADNHGIPRSLYSDRHSIFFSPNKDKLSIEEELAGVKVPLTQFGKALHELSINHIPARSPQAKGRVERLWGTLQSRLVIEMRLDAVSSIEQANAFLPGFIRRFNQHFAVVATDPVTAFKTAPPANLLDQIISFREERKASNGSTISFSGKVYQLIDDQGSIVALSPRSKVSVRLHLDGSINALHHGFLYDLKEYVKPLNAEYDAKDSKNVERKKFIPAADHPWRRSSTVFSQDQIDSYLELKRKFA
jgi:hypothetical protein